MNKKLKDMRLSKGLSQSQLAEEAGLNVRTLQHYEQGTKNFDNAKIGTIFKVAIALDCKIEDIIQNPDYLKLIEHYNAYNLR